MDHLEGLLNKINVQDREIAGRLLEHVPAGGATIGNTALRRHLKLLNNEDEYWRVRNRLIELGLLQKAGGKGGSVLRTPLAMPTRPRFGPVREHALYPDVLRILRDCWQHDQAYAEALVVDVADQGSRDTGGAWTRPDLLVVGLRRYELLARSEVEIVTFEVKPADAVDVTAVYEALAHRQCAHRSYVFFHLPDRHARLSAVKTIEDAARELGIGLILASDPTDYSQWDIVVEASYVEPRAHRLNQFLQVQLPESETSRLRTWLTVAPAYSNGGDQAAGVRPQQDLVVS